MGLNLELDVMKEVFRRLDLNGNRFVEFKEFWKLNPDGPVSTASMKTNHLIEFNSIPLRIKYSRKLSKKKPPLPNRQTTSMNNLQQTTMNDSQIKSLLSKFLNKMQWFIRVMYILSFDQIIEAIK